MKAAVAGLLAFVAAAQGVMAGTYAHAHANSQVSLMSATSTDHPIKKIIAMLEELADQSKAQGQEEELDWQKFESWYRGTVKELTKLVSQDNEDIGVLEGEVESYTKEIEYLEKGIAWLNEMLEKLDRAGMEADQIRQKEANLYKKTDADYSQTIAAIATGIQELEKEKAKAGASLLELSQSLLEKPEVKKSLDTLEAYLPLLQSDDREGAIASFLQVKRSAEVDGATGEEACENKDYDQHACEAVGCCVFRDSACFSNVGQEVCGEAADAAARHQALLRVDDYSQKSQLDLIHRKQQAEQDEIEQLLAKQELQQQQIADAMQRHQGGGSQDHVGRRHVATPERPDNMLSKGDRAKHVDTYSFKSGNVIELLKQLEKQFEKELTAANKAETNAINAYDLAKQARDDTLMAAKYSRDEKVSILGEMQGNLAEAQGHLKEVRKFLSDDEAALKETETTYSVRKQEWDERTKVRGLEVEAIKAAVVILSKVTNVQTNAPQNPVPPPSPLDKEAALFLQISEQSEESPKLKALSILRTAAASTHSKALSQLAKQLSMLRDGPLDEVVQMIQKMIFKLMEEQTSEDEHKHWCDEELEKTNTSMAHKESKVGDLTESIDAITATIAQLTGDISNARDMIADLVAFEAEATETRETGKKENKVALKDSKDAQAAIAQASAVLRDFYKDSGMIEKEGPQLPDEPGSWGGSYTGVADPTQQPQGILAVLARAGEEFATMESDIKAQEAQDQQEYEHQMSDLAIEKAGRTKEVEIKEDERKAKNSELSRLKKNRDGVQKELDTVNNYMSNLQRPCVEGGSTYKARKAARDQEIKALKDAQYMLKNPSDAASDASETPAPKFLQVKKMHISAHSPA